MKLVCKDQNRLFLSLLGGFLKLEYWKALCFGGLDVANECIVIPPKFGVGHHDPAALSLCTFEGRHLEGSNDPVMQRTTRERYT